MQRVFVDAYVRVNDNHHVAGDASVKVGPDARRRESLRRALGALLAARLSGRRVAGSLAVGLAEDSWNRHAGPSNVGGDLDEPRVDINHLGAGLRSLGGDLDQGWAGVDERGGNIDALSADGKQTGAEVEHDGLDGDSGDGVRDEAGGVVDHARVDASNLLECGCAPCGGVLEDGVSETRELGKHGAQPAAQGVVSDDVHKGLEVVGGSCWLQLLLPGEHLVVFVHQFLQGHAHNRSAYRYRFILVIVTVLQRSSTF
jgi:hypothetical protein